MDDDDADYMQGSDDEVRNATLYQGPPHSTLHFQQDYGFDYSDGDEGDEGGSADVENMYYKAKCMVYPQRNCQ